MKSSITLHTYTEMCYLFSNKFIMWNLFPREGIGRAHLIFDIISEDLLNADLRIPTVQFLLTHCSVADKGIVYNVMLRGKQDKWTVIYKLVKDWAGSAA